MKTNNLQIQNEWPLGRMYAFGIVSGFQPIFSVHPGVYLHSKLTQEHDSHLPLHF